MMRLIDADNIYNVGDFVILHEDGNAYVPLADLCKIIDIQPTVYDIDKVVEELEERKALHERLVDYETKNGTVTEKYQHIKAIDVLNDAIEIVKAGNDTKDNPRREAYLKALEDYHDSVQNSCIKWASTFGRRERQFIPYLIKESNTIFQMLKVGASEIE